jgi:UDP-glucose:(heptosyl)LPS alpha-1,3-glucosyltransferase
MAEAIRLAVESFEVHVFSTSLAEDIRTRVVWHRIRVPRRPAALAFLWFFMVCGARLRRMRADVVHTLGAIVPNRADVATVQFCHAAYRRVGGRLGPEGVAFLRRINTGIARWIALLAETWCYRPSRLKAFAAVSEGIVDELAHHYSGIPAAVTPNGVDTRRFAPNAAARQEVRVENGLDNGQVVALFVGGEWPRKGLELAIRGFAASRDTGGPARLWIVGRGDAERYAKLVAQLGLSDTVDFLGPRNNVERFLAGADIFVFPTLYEAFPLAVLEAAATGLAIVATPVNGVSELLRDGSEALLVQRDPDSIAAALSRLAREPELRRRLGAEARLRAGAYDWERSSASVIRLYENIISGGTP